MKRIILSPEDAVDEVLEDIKECSEEIKRARRLESF